MNFAFSEEQEEFRATLRRFLDERSPLSEVRRAMATREGYDPSLWKTMAAELGLQGLHLPEVYGGQGFGLLELGIAQEELGRALVPGPFFSTVCLAANAILNVGSEGDQRALLPDVASGARTATLAWLETVGTWDGAGVALECRPEHDGFVLDGAKSIVTDGASTDLLLVVARLLGTRGDAGLTLLRVERGAAGLSIETPESLDPTRRVSRVSFVGVRAAAVGAPGAAALGLERTLHQARTCLAFEMLGGAQRCLDMAVAYAKQRVQFGRPIGAFQAIKHKCADVLLELELARSAVHYAGWAAGKDPAQLPLAASLAKAAASDAYLLASAENLQIHGGVGYTWEYDPQLFYKRAKSSEVLLGDASCQRAAIAERLGL